MIKPDLFKQDVSIADATGTARLTLWQEKIGSLEVGKCYKMEGFRICSVNNTKYLTPPKSGYEITAVDDIGQIQDHVAE